MTQNHRARYRALRSQKLEFQESKIRLARTSRLGLPAFVKETTGKKEGAENEHVAGTSFRDG